MLDRLSRVRAPSRVRRPLPEDSLSATARPKKEPRSLQQELKIARKIKPRLLTAPTTLQLRKATKNERNPNAFSEGLDATSAVEFLHAQSKFPIRK
jgi:hypothetical protein